MRPEDTQDSLHDAELSRRYRSLHWERPPASLDNRILRRARDAVVDSAKPRRWLLPPMWLTPLATAATVLVVVGVVRLLPEPEPATPAPVAVDLPQSKDEGAITEFRDGRARAGAADEAMSLQESTPAPARKSLGVIPPQSDRSSNLPVEAEADAPAAAKPAKTPAANTKLSKELRSRQAATAAPEPETAAALEQQSRSQSATAPKQDEAPAESEAASPGAAALGRAAVPTRTPDQWIQRIKDLAANKQTEQARRELEAFTRTYPDHPQLQALTKLLQ